MGVYDQAARFAAQADPAVVIEVALVFAGLAERAPAWQRGMEVPVVTESPIVNTWIERGVRRERLLERRRQLPEVPEIRFPANMSPEPRLLVEREEDSDLFATWISQSLRAATYQDFLDALRG